MNRKLIKLRLLICKNGIQRAEFIKNNHLFYNIGDHCYWHPTSIPNEGYLMNIHNNVAIASNVTFVTHDIMEYVFNQIGGGVLNISNTLDRLK